MFTEARHDPIASKDVNKQESRRPYTLHKVNTFFSAVEVTILRHAITITPLSTTVTQADFDKIASDAILRKIFMRLCVLGFFTKLVKRDVNIKDPVRQEQLKRRTLYKVNKNRIADLLAKLNYINDVGVDRADRSMVLAASSLNERKEPITTLDLVFFTTLSGTRLVQWIRGNKDLLQRVQVEGNAKTYNHYFTKKIRSIVRVWEDIHSSVALHSKMK